MTKRSGASGDSETTVAQLREEVQRFVAERDWERHHSPKNLGMSIAIEAAEIMEHFQWLSIEQSIERVQDPAARAQVADELADVLIYCLSFANQADIDVSRAIRAKLDRNQDRFPQGHVLASFG
jgi:NTP pyrophosphatase (non-canonical NTP hydrolase)